MNTARRRIDADYFTRREAFAAAYAEVPLLEVADQWPLYVGTMNLARHLALYDLLRPTLTIPGHIAELGVWHGSTLLFLAKMLQILDPHGLTELYGFDTFTGLEDGRYRGDEARLRAALVMANVQDQVQLIKGPIEDTLPVFLAERPEAMFRCVVFDADAYLPTKVGLDQLMERMSVGGVLIFDEYNCAGHPGETLAVRELLRRYPLRAVPHTRQPTAYCVVS